jgi:2-octaprenyl-6-methoxyphenol hydroxylase
MFQTDYDITILGAGMAGMSIAISLAEIDTKQSLRIAVIEKVAFDAGHQKSFDDRCIALSAGSRRIYQSMGIWQHINAVEPIKNIHISEQGKMGFARLNHQQENVDALGYVVESQALGKVLLQQLQQSTIDIFCPAQVNDINVSSDMVTIKLTEKKPENTEKNKTITSSVIIAADGSHSFCHPFLSTAPIIKKYQQCAIIANIETEYTHQGEAFERFTESGPLAVLPLTENRCSLVWTVNETELDNMMSLSDNDFLQQLQQRFGYRLGKIQHIGKRFSYPLALMSLEISAATQLQRMLFIGNAAHSIHPVTGQGFNLGLRDISALTQLIQSNIQQHNGQFIYQPELIKKYWLNREKDIQQVTRFTDSLIKVFSNKTFPLTPARNIALMLFELYQPLKSLLARFAMGIQRL